jgi:hypothetical protein
MEGLSILLAGCSFLLSLYALWITQLWRGKLKMTQPTLLRLTREKATYVPKIILKTCLFTTAPKGCVIESMYLKVHQSCEPYIFDIWHYEETTKLALGSGLFVGSTGVSYNHHFYLRREQEEFRFVDGEYKVEVFASVVGQSNVEKLKEISFSVDGQQSSELIQIPSRYLMLLWNTDTHSYKEYVEPEGAELGRFVL